MYSGDPTARDLLKTLLTDASKPYLKMLTLWIHKGVIDDPYEEFLVREFKSIPRERLDLDYTDEYWEKRYTIRKDDLPLQLSSSEVYEKVLLAGKYLNVVRECGGTDVSKDVDETFESIEDSRIVLSAFICVFPCQPITVKSIDQNAQPTLAFDVFKALLSVRQSRFPDQLYGHCREGIV
jgi:hypothetical protein